AGGAVPRSLAGFGLAGLAAAWRRAARVTLLHWLVFVSLRQLPRLAAGLPLAIAWLAFAALDLDRFTALVRPLFGLARLSLLERGGRRLAALRLTLAGGFLPGARD